MVKDIVCGMGIEEHDPETFVKSFRGKKFYFCSSECMSLFSKDPEDYLHPTVPPMAMARDPVCGMEVDENNAPCTSVHSGKTYYFCCNTCKHAFEREPERFIEEYEGRRH